MQLWEIKQTFPLSCALFKTPKTDECSNISRMMTLYGGQSYGTGAKREYNVGSFRVLVGHRLISQALFALSGASMALRPEHMSALAAKLKLKMPDVIRIHDNGFTLTIDVPPHIRDELNRRV